MSGKLSTVLLTVGLLVTVYLPAAEKIEIKLPIRVCEKRTESIELKKNDLELLINGQEREIIALKKQEKTLGKKTGLGRNFILSFHITDYDSQVKEGVAYFIDDILNVRDILIILTPLKIYKIRVSRNKAKMIEMIGELLVRDCGAFNKNRITSEKNLENKLNRLRAAYANIRNDRGGVSTYVTTIQFLNTYPQELVDFMIKFIISDVQKYEQATGLLEQREGDRWWIHFQQRESFSIISKTHRIIDVIYNFITLNEQFVQALASGMKRQLTHLKNQLSFHETFPTDRLVNAVIGRNVSYNVIFFGSLKNFGSDGPYSAAVGLENVLKQICKESGGNAVISNDIEKALKQIVENRDFYYELIYHHDGKIEGKTIEVGVKNRNIKLCFKNKFKKDEMESLIQHFSAKKVEIKSIQSVENRISFLVKGFKFKRNQQEKYGLLSVRLELLDKQGRTIFKTERNLRVSKDQTRIAITLPTRFHGHLKLGIRIIDLIANNSVSEQRSIHVPKISPQNSNLDL